MGMSVPQFVLFSEFPLLLRESPPCFRAAVLSALVGRSSLAGLLEAPGGSCAVLTACGGWGGGRPAQLKPFQEAAPFSEGNKECLVLSSRGSVRARRV